MAKKGNNGNEEFFAQQALNLYHLWLLWDPGDYEGALDISTDLLADTDTGSTFSQTVQDEQISDLAETERELMEWQPHFTADFV